MRLPETLNTDYIAAQYEQWKKDQDSVSKDWQYFFRGFEVASTGSVPAAVQSDKGLPSRQANVERLIYGYRSIGHMLACMDPLSACPTEHPLLSLEAFDLNLDDLNSYFYTESFSKTGSATLKEILAWLRETYCRSIGVEYMHLQDPKELKWLQDGMEPVRNQPELENSEKQIIVKRLYQAALFEQFLNKKYVGVTRFSLEGGDAIIPLIDNIMRQAVIHGCRETIIGTAHRGRLNIQSHILGKPYEEIFREFESCYDPEQLVGSGDVKYHNGYLSDVEIEADKSMRMFLLSTPSHLEAIDPVVEGVARARQENLGQGREVVLPLLIHGDAAFSGQGIVAETLNMSQLEGYTTGGTIHIVINNQIGYTTLPEDARSTRYSTDIAKMLMAPIFHVHGENLEAVVHVGKLAVDYRKTFEKDVVIDVICYRRYGHNEGDEPYFTQPKMYDRIKSRPYLHLLYAEKLLNENVMEKKAVEKVEKTVQDALETAYGDVHGSECLFPESKFFESWDGYYGTYSHDVVETAVDKETLLNLARKLNTFPEAFNIHPKLKRLFNRRLEMVEKWEGIDWASAESLAFASLLMEGVSIRMSGQDVGRGTFSQRHSVLFDTTTGDRYIPLNHLKKGQAKFAVYNSLLAEASVLGFEYGYSISQPDKLVFWEAQFGDFTNNAQAIIDLFIASGQAKWERLSGLVMLLPHGWEGLGPDHSSARLERFLQLCAEDNMQICNLTTPAQYFHLIRRQIKEPFRKPLVLMTPKSLLRHPMAVSSLDDFTSSGFRSVLDDQPSFSSSGKVILCSGKIFYQLLKQRSEQGEKDTAIIRLEQFYPFPEDRLRVISGKYKKAQHWIWVQEEPENMGGWQFVKPRFENRLGKPLRYIGRKAASSPATGFPMVYKEQQEAISMDAFSPHFS